MIDWNYQYTEDYQTYVKEHQSITRLLDEIEPLSYEDKCKRLQAEGYPWCEPSVAWVFKHIQKDASPVEVMEEIGRLLAESKQLKLIKD